VNSSVEDLKSQGNFARVVVHNGTWIFYKYKDYSDRPDNNDTWIKLLTPSEHEVNISNFNGSVFFLGRHTEGMYLFEHANYGGHRKVTI